MREEVRMEEIETSPDRWYWVAESENETALYHVVHVNADSDGVCDFQFNAPSFAASNFCAWMYENANLGGSFYKEQIEAENFINEYNYDRIAGYYTRLYQFSSFSPEMLGALCKAAPLVEVVSQTYVRVVYASSAQEKKFQREYRPRWTQSRPEWDDARYIRNPGNLVNWEIWG